MWGMSRGLMRGSGFGLGATAFQEPGRRGESKLKIPFSVILHNTIAYSYNITDYRSLAVLNLGWLIRACSVALFLVQLLVNWGP